MASFWLIESFGAERSLLACRRLMFTMARIPVALGTMRRYENPSLLSFSADVASAVSRGVYIVAVSSAIAADCIFCQSGFRK